jgi:hypothetical protein
MSHNAQQLPAAPPRKKFESDALKTTLIILNVLRDLFEDGAQAAGLGVAECAVQAANIDSLLHIIATESAKAAEGGAA